MSENHLEPWRLSRELLTVHHVRAQERLWCTDSKRTNNPTACNHEQKRRSAARSSHCEAQIYGSASMIFAGTSQATMVSTEFDCIPANATDVRLSAKLKLFALTCDFKLLFLRCVQKKKEKRVVHVKKYKLFSKFRDVFMAQVTSPTCISHRRPFLKRLREKSRAIVAERK